MVTSLRTETMCLACLCSKGTSTGSPRVFGCQEDVKEGWQHSLACPSPAFRCFSWTSLRISCQLDSITLYVNKTKQKTREWDRHGIPYYGLHNHPTLQPPPHYMPKLWVQLRRHWETSLNFKVVGRHVSAFSLAWSKESMNCVSQIHKCSLGKSHTSVH